jgi:hypothetical protein
VGLIKYPRDTEACHLTLPLSRYGQARWRRLLLRLSTACAPKKFNQEFLKTARSWRASFPQDAFRDRLFAARGKALPGKLFLRFVVVIHGFTPYRYRFRDFNCFWFHYDFLP